MRVSCLCITSIRRCPWWIIHQGGGNIYDGLKISFLNASRFFWCANREFLTHCSLVSSTKRQPNLQIKRSTLRYKQSVSYGSTHVELYLWHLLSTRYIYKTQGRNVF